MVLGFADEMKKVIENIGTSYNIRIGEVKDIIRGTQSELKDFHTNRMHMSEEQRKELAHFTKELRDATNELMNGFSRARKEMAASLMGDLHKYHNSLSKDTQAMLNAFKNNMKALANEFHQAHNVWLNFSRSMMEAKRGMKQIPKEEIPQQGTGRKRRGHSKRK